MSTNQVLVCVFAKLLIVRERGKVVELDPTWVKYAALQVAGVGYSTRLIHRQLTWIWVVSRFNF